ncbi:sensor histidine kinase [Algoriphagus halophilus]|uniref:histidine kinase n=1 Tax=Algoriphagus halophilus TaxID=226505 RepID=A0A1N6G315_9BACT|nr:ATP-binding protein [Algoriphagus halophilus]SIO01887.1 His Kinase A (phospho-acceptor) domain-containing protein [Algoriphagus halophilus]
MLSVNIISIILLFTLKRPLGTIQVSEEWKRLFNYGIIAAIALMVIEWIPMPSLISFIASIAGYLLISAIVYVTLQFPALEHKKGVVYAWLPIIVISIITEIFVALAPDFYNKWDSYFETAEAFAFIWAIAMWIINAKQKKNLEKERIKALEKEKELEITEQLKNQFEQQVKARTAELTAQKNELEKIVQELKSTQSQLIHAEKMASLGELTAGIAHEIQNPLNFVNNFSELSNELLVEMKEEIEAGNYELALEIVDDITQNLQKIAHHGNRADSIVKGMLQHSRINSGEKELTDLNALADEFLRLSYHGLRAKDKSFNSDFKLNLDPNLPKVKVVAQDFGRLILNLVNNAFFAVNEKKSKLDPNSEEGKNYHPTVIVTTSLENNKIKITVSDNGSGIPKSIKEKIFQPFFTTKPTGSGTGLGLSLSYDIVKAHGGDFKVDSVEGEETTFTIILPLDKLEKSDKSEE